MTENKKQLLRDFTLPETNPNQQQTQNTTTQNYE